ncbi:uncharacterized protein LOC135213871 [Macrobrachium nipponense]|uniref:uncharacterized protein LOC135213871 n=1 Tax=Macrobrachium nipponense TaxID=159736 RepID=UPI0030C8B3A6
MQGEQDIVVNVVGDIDATRLLDWERFSRADKVFKTIAWIMRFIKNCKLSTNDTKTGGLTLEELQEGKVKTIVLVQREYFPEEYKALKREETNPKLTLIRQLNLFLDNNVMRCRGRLEHATLPEEVKFPTLLPKGCVLRDVVLVHDEGPRNKWKLGQVIQVHVGSDNVVRVATLKTSHGQIMRPIVKLYPLELWQEVETPDPAKIPEMNLDDVAKYTYLIGSLKGEPLKKLWEAGMGWDDMLSKEHQPEASKVLDEFNNVHTFKFNRGIILGKTELHLFTNASIPAQDTDKVDLPDSQIIRSSWKWGFFERLIEVVKSTLATALRRNVFSEEQLRTLIKEAKAVVNNRPLMYTGDMRDDEVLTQSHLIGGDVVRLLPPVVPHKDMQLQTNRDPRLFQTLLEGRLPEVTTGMTAFKRTPTVLSEGDHDGQGRSMETQSMAPR